MEYDNTNRGTLGKNANKKSDSHPDYSGQLNIDGVDYWLSGWLKESKKDGSKFFSLAVKPKDSKPSKARQKPVDDFRDDDLADAPFWRRSHEILSRSISSLCRNIGMGKLQHP